MITIQTKCDAYSMQINLAEEYTLAEIMEAFSLALHAETWMPYNIVKAYEAEIERLKEIHHLKPQDEEL